MMTKVVVIGAGQAASTLVSALREKGFEGEITVLGNEGRAPYERPPLSKGYLSGKAAADDLLIRPECYYAENRISLCPDSAALRIDRQRQMVVTAARDHSYDQLVIATGARPRKIPAEIGGALDGVYTLRTIGDVGAMRPSLVAGAHAVIVGGGYIGLEAAATFRELGLEVTVVEMAERILQRVAAKETSDYFRQLHQSRGVRIMEGTGLKSLTGSAKVTGAVLADGTELAADIVLVGIGVAPTIEIAVDAGLEIDNGIAVDASGKTSDPAIWAIGDCASFQGPLGRIRLESVPNAIAMAELVADNILGASRTYSALPWFWSDQYDVTLQIAGLNLGYDRVIERIAGPAFSHWYFRGETLVSVDALNDPRAFQVGKRLLEMGKSPSEDSIRDVSSDLKILLRR
jgi:3-phenylpropionate/trans-cinnamate dioxygenase ferredoxin reductase subunit